MGSAPVTSVTLPERLAFEISKPKDWQAFQRNCVLLFQAALNDPHAQEYGRGGQAQHGIDIIGRRDGDPERYVGIQCRRIGKPIKQETILKDCRDALKLEVRLKEIIFATTAPQDTGAIDAAAAVERTLRAEGHNVNVVVYGWEALQVLIAEHPSAYAAFCPSSVGSTAVVTPGVAAPQPDFAAQVAKLVARELRAGGLPVPPADSGAVASNDEDPALHARIDAYRDLFKEEKQPVLAEKGLLALIKNSDVAEKPWARFRIETNLASIALDLGREAEGAARYEAAYAIRPDDANAIANLALARVIQGRHEEAMELATKALRAEPRAPHAVGYLLQAAARSAWSGTPDSLIPDDLAGNVHADLGLGEFLRLRKAPDWARRTIELSEKHLEVAPFRRIRAMAILELAINDKSVIAGGHGAVTLEQLNSAADDMKAAVETCLTNGYAEASNLAALASNSGLLLRLAGRHDACETLLKARRRPSEDTARLRGER